MWSWITTAETFLGFVPAVSRVQGLMVGVLWRRRSKMKSATPITAAYADALEAGAP
jgi:hypothetical protein